MIFTAVKSYKIVQCHREMTSGSTYGYDGDVDTTMTMKKVSGGHHHNCAPTLRRVTAAVVAILLVSCSCAANAEPVAPVQVAAAVATATGTGEIPAVSVEKPADVLEPSPLAEAFSQPPQPQSTSSESEESRSSATTQAAAVTENGDHQNKLQLTNDNNDQQDEKQRQQQQQLLLAPLLMPPTQMSAVWSSQSSSQQPMAVDVIPAVSSLVGRERTEVEIMSVPSSSEQHLVDSPLIQAQPEYKYIISEGSLQSESELQQPELELRQPEPELRQPEQELRQPEQEPRQPEANEQHPSEPSSEQLQQPSSIQQVHQQLQTDQTAGAAGKQHQPVPPFRPSHPVWASQYPVPWTYYVKSSMVQPGRPAPFYAQHNNYYGGGRKSRYVLQQSAGAVSNRVSGGYSPIKPPRTKVVYIEYGGFKPKMVPSVQISSAEDYDGNRRQLTVLDGGVASDITAQEVGQRDNPVAASTPATADATTASATATATTTTTVAAAAATVTTTTTGTIPSTATSVPIPRQQQSQQQQQPVPERQPPAAGVVVVVV
ncbi:hypothetical protein ACI65C_005646 [Semiaphis heraclei]